MMGLGVMELVILGGLCLGGLLFVAGVVVLVFVFKKRKGGGGTS